MGEAKKIPIDGTCNICQAVKIALGDHVITEESQGEIYDIMTPLIVQRGWAIRRGLAGGRELVCPVCVKELERRETCELPRFIVGAACAKCGSDKIVDHYCTSREAGCTFVVDREHMHRTCSACGFTTLTATADARRPWWKFWR